MDLVLLSIGFGALAVLYGWFTSMQVLRASPGNAKMQEIAAAIQEGAQAYLGRQYRAIGIVGVAILSLVGILGSTFQQVDEIMQTNRALSGVTRLIGALDNPRSIVYLDAAGEKEPNNSKYLMIGTLFEALANIFFDYGLIYGHFGLPELGFNGAAYASIIAEVTGMLVVFLVIFVKRMHIQFHLFRYLRYNKQLSNLILNISAPLIGQFSISIMSWFVFYILIEHHGERALAVSNVMRNIFSLSGVFIWAFASTTNAMVSNIIGQGRNNDVMKLIYRIMSLSFVSAVLMFLLFNVFAVELLSVFRLSKEFVDAAVPVLRIVTTGMLFMSVSVVWLNAVTGTGNTKMNLLIEAVTIVLYLIYIYVVLEVYQLNLMWAWASELIYWNSILLMAFFYIKSGKWKGKVI